MENKRNQQIDVLRGIAIMLVVWAHVPLPFGRIINFFHMPLFFIISGYLFRGGGFEKFIKRKIERLYIPFVSVQVLFLVFRNILVELNIYNENSSWTKGKIESWGGYFEELIHIFCFDNCDLLLSPTWFLSVLFICSIMFWFIKKIVKDLKLCLVICTICMLIGIILTEYEIGVDWLYGREKINTSLVALFFYALGHNINMIGESCEKTILFIMSKKVLCIGFILIGVVTLFCFDFILNMTVGMVNNAYSNVPGFLFCSILGCVLIYIVSCVIVKIELLKRFFCLLSKYSLEIMIMHWFMAKGMSFLIIFIKSEPIEKLGYIVTLPNLNYIYYFIYFVWMLVASITVSILINKLKVKL